MKKLLFLMCVITMVTHPRYEQLAKSWGRVFRRLVKAPQYRDDFRAYLGAQIRFAAALERHEEAVEREKQRGNLKDYSKDPQLQRLEEHAHTLEAQLINDGAYEPNGVLSTLARLEKCYKVMLARNSREANPLRESKAAWVLLCACSKETFNL